MILTNITWFVPTTAGVLAEFTKLKSSLEKVFNYHAEQRNKKVAEIEVHTQEIQAAGKALDAVQKFI